VTIDGFTIRNGWNQSYVGAGLDIRWSVGVVLRDLVVTDNQLTQHCSAEFIPAGCTLQFPEPFLEGFKMTEVREEPTQLPRTVSSGGRWAGLWVALPVLGVLILWRARRRSG